MEEELTLEEKCENLMYVVVETRKKFGPICIQYEKKRCILENKQLNLQLETITSHQFKPKIKLPDIDMEKVRSNFEDRNLEVLEREKKIDNLMKRLKDTQSVVSQFKKDKLTEKMRMSLTASSVLARAKKHQ